MLIEEVPNDPDVMAAIEGRNVSGAPRWCGGAVNEGWRGIPYRERRATVSMPVPRGLRGCRAWVLCRLLEVQVVYARKLY
jgi:hypothetical protein